MKITPTQRMILEHRLDAGVIPDVLAESEICTVEQGEIACASIERMLRENEIKFEILTQWELEVVIDCLDGSAFFANSKDAVALGEISKSQLNTMHKAADQLQDEILKTTGRKVYCVRD